MFTNQEIQIFIQNTFPEIFFFSNFRIETNSKSFTTLSSQIIIDFSPKKSDQILLLRLIQILLEKITTIPYSYKMLRKTIKKLLSHTFCLQICSSLSSPLSVSFLSPFFPFFTVPFPPTLSSLSLLMIISTVSSLLYITH